MLTDDYSSLEDIACEPWLACVGIAIAVVSFYIAGLAHGSVLLWTAVAVAGVAVGYFAGWAWDEWKSLEHDPRIWVAYIEAMEARP